MRLKQLFVFLWVFIPISSVAFPQRVVDRQEIRLVATDDENTSDDETREGQIIQEGPAAMSLLPSQSPYAYLYNNKVYVSFEGLTGISGIRVVDNVTGTVVYEENCAGATEVIIRLDEPGDYTLQVVADGTVWEGWFVY